MKPSDKSYFNAKFSLVMAFVIEMLANQMGNGTVKWILIGISFIEILSAIYETISMIYWQKAEAKEREAIAEKIKEMRKDFDECVDAFNKALDEEEKEEKPKAKRKTTKKKVTNDCNDEEKQDQNCSER